MAAPTMLMLRLRLIGTFAGNGKPTNNVVVCGKRRSSEVSHVSIFQIETSDTELVTTRPWPRTPQGV